MDFNSTFNAAICEAHGPTYWFQKEELLRVLYNFYARSRGCLDRDGFIEIMTLIEETQNNLLSWKECKAFLQCKEIPQERKNGATKLDLLASSQRFQLDKLVVKLQSMV